MKIEHDFMQHDYLTANTHILSNWTIDGRYINYQAILTFYIAVVLFCLSLQVKPPTVLILCKPSLLNSYDEAEHTLINIVVYKQHMK